MSTDHGGQVLEYTEEVIAKNCISRPHDYADSGSDEDQIQFDCHVSADAQERRFIEIDQAKHVTCIHNQNTKELRKKDKIIAINGKKVHDKTADEVQGLLASCLMSEDGCSSMLFTLSVIRISEDKQGCEEMTIRFDMSMTCDINHIHVSPMPETYTRHINRKIPSTSKKEKFIIRAKSRLEQELKYLTVENDKLQMSILSSGTREKGVFAFKKWKVITRSAGGRQKAREAYTIQWNDLYLTGSEERGLCLEHAKNDNGVPDDEALFRKRNVLTKGTAIESVLYMYYYIYYNMTTNKVTFYEKRPKEHQYLGQTRRAAPDECRFDIVPASDLPADVDYQEEKVKPTRLCFRRKKRSKPI